MQISYFQPKNTYLNQSMMCWYEGHYYLYYQCDDTCLPRDAEGCQGWNLALYDASGNYKIYEMVLKQEKEVGRNETLRAGNVIVQNGQFYACYSLHDGSSAKIIISESKDGIQWKEKKIEAPILPPEYREDVQAMPSLYYEEESWLLNLAVEKKACTSAYKGSVLQYQSQDMKQWVKRDAGWSPMRYEMVQRPFFFSAGEWQYLLYSEYCDEGKMHYRKRKNGENCWRAPDRDCMDGRCFEMGGVFQKEGTWYVYGILPIRKLNSELGDWSDRGGLLVHKIVQQKDGNLFVAPLEEKKLEQEEKKVIVLEHQQGNTEFILCQNAGSRYRVDFVLEFSEATYRFGVKLYENSVLDNGYAYRFVPGEKKVEFDHLPNMKWFIYLNKGMAQSISLEAGKKYPATLIVQDEISVLYVNGVALAARMKEKPGKELKFYVESGKLTVSEIIFSREAED